MADKADAEVELLAAFVHGALASLHGLALVYNYRKGRENWFDVLAHSLALGYDLRATVVHSRRVRR